MAGININVRHDYTENERFNGIQNLIRPLYGNASIADIPDVARKALGVKTKHNHRGVTSHDTEQVDHLIFFFLDGFGFHSLKRSAEKFPMKNTKEFLENASLDIISSTFPSTTATATISCHTSLTPSEHGVMGYIQYLGYAGSVCNMLAMSPLGRTDPDILDGFFDVRKIEESGTIHSVMRENDITPYYYSPAEISGSNLSRIAAGAAETRGYISQSQIAAMIQSDLERESGKSFHFCYIPTIDTISHKVGPFTGDTAMDIDSIFRLILQVQEYNKADRKIGVIVSADHGHTLIRENGITDMAEDRYMKRILIAPVVGEIRAPFLHFRSGELDNGIDRIRTEYPEFLPIKFNEALRTGLMGEIKQELKGFGSGEDLILVPLSDVGMNDSSLALHDPAYRKISMKGYHGGMSLEEMRIPLISWYG